MTPDKIETHRCLIIWQHPATIIAPEKLEFNISFIFIFPKLQIGLMQKVPTIEPKIAKYVLITP
jgi:hypothetical protein